MNKSFLAIMLACLLMILQRNAFAQQRLDLYADQAMSQCSLVDDAPGLKFVYVFLNGPTPASSVGFVAPRPACWQGATWITDVLPLGPRGSYGNTQTDFWVTLADDAGCHAPPLLVCSILFLTTGAALPCCQISVAPINNPESLNLPLYYINCGWGEVPLAIGRKVTINPNASCPCMGPVATESSTWGRVKSLYR